MKHKKLHKMASWTQILTLLYFFMKFDSIKIKIFFQFSLNHSIKICTTQFEQINGIVVVISACSHLVHSQANNTPQGVFGLIALFCVLPRSRSRDQPEIDHMCCA